MAIDIRYRGRRAPSLGQIDSELEYGPEPLPIRDVPIDIRGRQIQQYGPGTGPGIGTGILPNGSQDLSGLIGDVHSIAGTLVLRRGLIGRVVTVTSTPSLIINQQEIGGRGYLFLNPAGVVGLTAKGTLVSSTTIVGATTLQTASLGVANYKTAKLFFGVTFNAGAGPVTIDIETLDPVTGLLFISQTIGPLVATGNVYADLGTLGVDTDLSLLITVPVGTTITLTVGFVLKDGLDGTSAGVTQTIFIGAAGVSTVAGYPLLSGKERSFYIMENVQIYAVTAGPNLNMNIFEL
jgi:hypothetical protein